jgi:hypothetical protein
MTSTFSPEVIEALASLRTYAGKYPTMGLSDAVNTLDNAGVFAALDEQTGYTAAEDILAEAVSRSLDEAAGGPLDPAEWGDLSRTDIARRSASGPLG